MKVLLTYWQRSIHCFLLFVVALSSSIRLVFLSSWLYLYVQKWVDAAMIEQDERQTRAINQEIVRYWMSHQELLDIDGMTYNERTHMRDVRKLIHRIGVLWIASVLFLVWSRMSYKKWIKTLSTCLVVWVVLGVLVGILSLFQWFTDVFVVFHTLLFTGNWEFPAESLLIRLYPEQFFQVMWICLRSIWVCLLTWSYHLLVYFTNMSRQEKKS